MIRKQHVLMIHGAGGGAWEWNIWQRILIANNWQAHTLELNPKEDNIAETVFRDYLQQVILAAEKINTSVTNRVDENSPELILIGASLGGLLAMLAVQHVRPSALILLNPILPAPWHKRLPQRVYPSLIPWKQKSSLYNTQQALFDVDAATCELIWRRWRDESGKVMNEAWSGIAVEKPSCPILIMGSEHDQDIPPAELASLACAWNTGYIGVPGASHVGPLLGKSAVPSAILAHRWLSLVLAKSS